MRLEGWWEELGWIGEFATTCVGGAGQDMDGNSGIKNAG
jgi:hypothetical protein